MGYYADYDGYIKFNKTPSEDDLKELEYTFGEYSRSEETMFAVGGHEKYHSEDITDYFNKINKITEYGEIEYCGEDNCHWRFIFKDGKWIEEQGFVCYESELSKAQENKDEFLGSIIDIMQDDVLEKHKGQIIEGEWYDNIISKLESIMKTWKVFK